MMNCPNPRIKNPVKVCVISGPHKGKNGWADETPNKYGVVGFCNSTGKFPYQWNTTMSNLEVHEWQN